MEFEEALKHVKQGKRISRSGWNGKGMFLFHIPAEDKPSTLYPQLDGVYPSGSMVGHNAYLAMKTVDNTIVPWLCSQTDMLASDWGVVYEAERA